MVAPAPSYHLSQLLEDHQVEDAAGTDLVVIVAWNLVPMEAFECLGKRDDKGNG